MKNAVTYRTIIQTIEFERSLQLIEPDLRIADDFIRGIEWQLCRYPRIGTRIAPNSPIWFIPSADIRRLPRLAIYYAFNSDVVWLLKIENAVSVGD